MYFKPYYLGCLAHASYLIGGDSGEAAVIDPRRDVDEYIADAEANGLQIRYVIETHLHADFISGHIELARLTGAEIWVSHAAGAGFPHHPIREGDEIALGDVTLRFLETPGHTPEDISVVASVTGEDAPRMVFTGDTLFIGDIGRPDLAGLRTDFEPEDMARMMYRSLASKLLRLPDSTEVWPAHGAGSACGRALSDERVSTIGREQATNPALRFVVEGDETGFIRYDVEGLPPVPAYFRHDALSNKGGPRPVEEALASFRALTPNEAAARADAGAVVLDTRSFAEFGLAHLPRSIHVQLEGMFAPWAGAVVHPEAELVVVADEGREHEAAIRLARVGFDRLYGWLGGGVGAWQASGRAIASLPQLDAADLHRRIESGQSVPILDVRSPAEWERAHIPGSLHLPLGELIRNPAAAPPGELTVICGTGYRSSIACSLLERAGRAGLTNVAGGYTAWEAASGGSQTGKGRDLGAR